jgi:hypothetical protein
VLGNGYKIDLDLNGYFNLSYNSSHLVSFKRENFRESLDLYAKENDLSSHWVGSIQKLLNSKYPLYSQSVKRNEFERIVFKLGEFGLVDYLRQKGFRVIQKINVSDEEIIKYLEGRGYEVQGLIEDSYYSSIAFSDTN